MKPILTLVICSIFFSACKKEIGPTNVNGYLHKVKMALKDSMDIQNYSSLDFSKAVFNHVDSVSLYYLRVPFKGKTLGGDFVIVKTTKDGRLKQGKIVHLERVPTDYREGIIKGRRFNGNISISSLNRKDSLYSEIRDGFILAFHLHENTRVSIYPEDELLPEVVVVAYVNRLDAMDGSGWLLLSSLFYSSAGGGGDMYGSYYGSLNPDGYYYTGGGGGGGYEGSSSDGSGEVINDDPILIDLDRYANRDGIDIEQYLKCFDKIPDAAAQCEIGIYADIPVDSDPNKLFDFNSGSPGHTFIQIRKTGVNGDIISQNIGFYPESGWKTTLTNAPMNGKFVDNGGHEFNAGYRKSLTTEEFKSMLTEIRYLKNVPYDIDNYNCTDWALSVFNKQGYGLDIPLYDIPGNYPSVGTSMPQGIYNKLKEMKNNNDTHADKIDIGFLKAWVADSHGPCI
jgi:hypothetical protein